MLTVPFADTKYSFDFTLSCFRWLENFAEESALPHSVNPLEKLQSVSGKIQNTKYSLTQFAHQLLVIIYIIIPLSFIDNWPQ